MRSTILSSVGLSIVFALVAGSAPSAAEELCNPGFFCDRDGDGYVKSHKRCSACNLPVDCNDDVYDPDNECGGSGDELFSFLAELVDRDADLGSFKFDESGPVSFTKTRGNQSKAARILGTTRRILGYKMMQFGIDAREFKRRRT